MQNAQTSRAFVQRDYTLGTVVQFETRLPVELNSLVSEDAFRETVGHINEIFENAEAVDREAYLEGCLACLTLCTYYAWPCTQTKYEKAMEKLGSYIHRQNTTVYGPMGVRLIHPMERGLRVIEVVITRS